MTLVVTKTRKTQYIPMTGIKNSLEPSRKRKGNYLYQVWENAILHQIKIYTQILHAEKRSFRLKHFNSGAFEDKK